MWFLENIKNNPELFALFFSGLVLSFILGFVTARLRTFYKNKKKG
jgi:hypothetical protein